MVIFASSALDALLDVVARGRPGRLERRLVGRPACGVDAAGDPCGHRHGGDGRGDPAPSHIHGTSPSRCRAAPAPRETDAGVGTPQGAADTSRCGGPAVRGLALGGVEPRRGRSAGRRRRTDGRARRRGSARPTGVHSAVRALVSLERKRRAISGLLSWWSSWREGGPAAGLCGPRRRGEERACMHLAYKLCTSVHDHVPGTPDERARAAPARPLGRRSCAYEYVKARLLDGRFAGGTLLSENEIAQRLDVSRTPVRQAFVQLEAEGLLELYPAARRARRADLAVGGRGRAGGADADRAAQRAPRRARGPALAAGPAGHIAEQEEAARATARGFAWADRQFHGAIVEAAGNRLLTRQYDGAARPPPADRRRHDRARPVADRALHRRAPRDRRRARARRRRRRRGAARHAPPGRARARAPPASRTPSGSPTRAAGRPRRARPRRAR